MKQFLRLTISEVYKAMQKKLSLGIKLSFASIISFVFITSSVFGQDYSLPICSNGIGTNTYGPMYSSTTANYGNRTAFILNASALTSIAGNTLTSIWFNRLAASGSMTGTTNFKIYLKNTSLTDFGSGNLTWATEISTATNVFDESPTTYVGSTAGMKQFPFTTNFAYNGSYNLAVYLEYTQTTAQSAAINWDYEYGSPCVNTSNSNTTKYVNGATPLSATTTSTNYRRPIIAFSTVNNMSFVSATATQTSTANVYTGTNGNAIVGLQVITSGSTSPLSLTQLSMVATGSNPTADISKIHVYYTGTSNTFATTNAFDGPGTNAAAGTIVINGSQVLASGTNYFWIAYDVSATATSGNTLDARLLASPTTTLVVGGVAQTVTANDPAGSRTIAAVCLAPTAQPTQLSLSASGTTTINGSFNTSSPVADMYLIVRSTSASLGATPMNNTTYTTGNTIGTGTVVAYQPTTTFSNTGLASGTIYYYFVFAANACPTGPQYLATSPLTAYFATATNQTISIANFTADVVINGAGAATSSTTADCDSSNYCFVTNDFNPSGTVCTGSTYLLWPVAGGTITGIATPVISYTLQPAAGNNVFQVASSGTGTLNLTTPVMANNLYLLYVTGATPTAMPLVQVNFSDGSNQQFTTLSLINWCSNTGSPASTRYYRQDRTLTTCSLEPCPYFQQWSLAIDPANQTKMITSITFNNASGKFNVFAVSGAVINLPSSPCSGTPTPGNTTITSGNNPTCSGVSFTLGLQNFTSGSGVTYDWQSSDDGTFTGIHLTDAIGAASTLTTSQTIAKYYRCIVTCSGNSGTSAALQVTMNTVANNVASVTPTPGSGQVSVAWATPAGCYSDVMVVASPAANTGGTPTGSGYSGASLTYGSGTAFGNGYIVYEGTTSPKVVTGLTNGTPYYFKVFTRNGSNWSSGVEVSSTPIITYCSTLYTTGCSLDDIDNISVADLAQTATGCTGALTYANYTGTTVHFTANTTYPWTITSGMTGEYVGFWIDLNDNGSFGDAGEYMGGTTTSSTTTTITGNITIPAGAASGNHRMRVRLVYGTLQSLSTSCTSYTYGETHDYTVNIVASTMSFGSATAFQASTATVTTGTNGNAIVGLQVVTSGNTSPLSFTQLSMVATGTNPTADISKIHVYYTGTSSTFATTNAFDGAGTTVAAGTITINGSQVLAMGTNYFWIAYDVSATATVGNTLDARLLASPTTTLVVGAIARTVIVNDPSGSRTIIACSPPSAPTIGTITQPTCTVATGSVVLNNLPATGTWTLTRSPGSIVTTGTGTTTTITSLATGTYTFTVSIVASCPSAASTQVIINSQPATPPTPVISQVGSILHSNASGGNQWYNLAGLIGGAVNQDYTLTANGDYYDIVTLNGCKSDTSNILHVTTYDIEENLLQSKINIYPNPANDRLFVNFGEIKEIPEGIKIINNLGQVVFETLIPLQVNQSGIDVSHLNRGVYTIEIIFDKGIVNKSVIVK
jgi:hypothetical protein